MSPDRRRTVAGLAVVLALIAGAGCGEDERPVRIGVIVDCVGVNRSLENAELSGAALPLIERGARLHGRRAVDGVTSARLAGRRVELVPGCTELFEFARLTSEVRRLVENEKVDVLVAGGGGPDQVVLRDLARRYPEVVFLPVVHGPRQVTLRRPAPNLFRFSGDYGQGVAGLATHAYQRLGWRRAAVVVANWDPGWDSREAFTAEFCALGGSVTRQVAVEFFDRGGRDVAQVPENVDGVAVFTTDFFGPGGFLRRLARRMPNPDRQIVVGPGVIDDPALLRATGQALTGVTGTSYLHERALRRYERAFARAFPGTPSQVARSGLVSGYRDAVETFVQGLERAGGQLGRVPSELARRRIALLGGPVRLDDHRQAVIATSLVRIGTPNRSGDEPALLPERTIRGVKQSIGGLLAPDLEPSDRPPVCRTSRPPPRWSR